MLPRPLATLAALAVLALPALAGCGDDSSDTATDSSSPAANGPACTYTSDGQPAAKDVEPPPDRATVSGEVAVTAETSAGRIDMTLDADAAPCTVNSFVSLAEQGYFDGTSCHRLTTAGIHVLQCGDPTATGLGGPGYSIEDEYTGQETYPAGTIAMARTRAPDSGGSQFFLVHGDTPLPPEYTVFGTVSAEGLKVVQEVAEGGTDDANGPGDGHPMTPVDIESVTVG